MAFCKFCQHELDEGSPVCPACGRDNTAEELTPAVPDAETPAEATQPRTSSAPVDASAPEAGADSAAPDAAETAAPASDEAAPEAAPADDAPSADAASGDAADGSDAAALDADAPLLGADAPLDENTPAYFAPPEKKKRSTGALVAIFIAAAVVVGAIVYIALNWSTVFGGSASTIDARDSYTASVDELTPDSAKMQAAVAQVGDHKLTNGQFQIYYWMQFYNLANTYGQYLSYMGLDTTKAFADQDSNAPVDENADTTDSTGSEAPATLTWEQYFIRSAIACYKEYTALADAATDAGMELSEEYQSYLDSLDDDLATQAESSGLDSAEAFVQASFGTGVTVDDYRSYMQTYLLAATYANAMKDVSDYTADDIEAYYDENASSYESSGVLKSDQNTVNVRHILVKPEQDEDSDGDGTNDASSDAAWEAAKAKADELYAKWQEDPTEDNFSTLATENSEDTGSASAGGLYEDVYPGQMVTDFNDWCFDAARQPGDSGIVKTTYGYHIMYFVSTGEHPYWYIKAENDYKDGIYNDRIDAVVKDVEVSVNYKNIYVNSVLDMTKN